MDKDNLAQQVALAAGALTAVGLTYFLYQKFFGRDKQKVLRISDVTPAQMAELLDQLVQSQVDMKSTMTTLAKEIYEKDMDFVQICECVQRVNPEDPLAPYGLTIEEFSQLLAIHNEDVFIRRKILKLTAGPDTETEESRARIAELTKTSTCEDLILIHMYMLQKLNEVVRHFKKEKYRELDIDARVATIAAQAFVAKVVQMKYGLTSDDLEVLTCHYHSVLQSDDRFFTLGTEMRQIVQSLVSASTGADDEEKKQEGS